MIRDGTVTVIGGHIGTGKTSFLNVCQFLCMMGMADYGLLYQPPKIVPAFVKTQIESALPEREFLIRLLRSAVESVRLTCAALSLDVPSECLALGTWLETLNSSESSAAEAA